MYQQRVRYSTKNHIENSVSLIKNMLITKKLNAIKPLSLHRISIYG